MNFSDFGGREATPAFLQQFILCFTMDRSATLLWHRRKYAVVLFSFLLT